MLEKILAPKQELLLIFFQEKAVKAFLCANPKRRLYPAMFSIENASHSLVCFDVENTWSRSLTKLHLTDPLSLPRKTASGAQTGRILAPLPPVDFAAGCKGSEPQPRAPSTSIWNRFALHPTPHCLGIKEERRLRLWAGGMSWGCLWGQAAQLRSTARRQQHRPHQLWVPQHSTTPFSQGFILQLDLQKPPRRAALGHWAAQPLLWKGKLLLRQLV